MKASELIEKLQVVIAEHGDLAMCINDVDGWAEEFEELRVETLNEHWLGRKHVPRQQVFVITN